MKKVFYLLTSAFLLLFMCTQVALLKSDSMTQFPTLDWKWSDSFKTGQNDVNWIKIKKGPAVKKASLNIEGGFLELKLKALPMDNIIESKLHSRNSVLDINAHSNPLHHQQVNVSVNHKNKSSNNSIIKVEANVDASLPYEKVSINSGLSDMKLDLRGMDIKHMEINAGASALEMNFGDKAEKSRVDINSGMSNISLNIPKNVGLKIYNTSFMNSITVNGNNVISQKDEFWEMQDQYESKDYATAKKTIDIYVNGGVSNDLKIIKSS